MRGMVHSQKAGDESGCGEQADGKQLIRVGNTWRQLEVGVVGDGGQQRDGDDRAERGDQDHHVLGRPVEGTVAGPAAAAETARVERFAVLQRTLEGREQEWQQQRRCRSPAGTLPAQLTRLADRLKRGQRFRCEGEGERDGGARPVERWRQDRNDVGAAHGGLDDAEDGDGQHQRQPGRGAKHDRVEGPASADDGDRRQGKEQVLSEAAQRGAEDDRHQRQRQRELPGTDATPSTVGQKDVDHDQQQQCLEIWVAVDEGGGKQRDRPRAPGERVADHGPRLLRLLAPYADACQPPPRRWKYCQYGPEPKHPGGTVDGSASSWQIALPTDPKFCASYGTPDRSTNCSPLIWSSANATHRVMTLPLACWMTSAA